MPSPVGHALGGLMVALAFAPPRHDADDPQNPDLRLYGGWAGWCIVAACLPDVDFAWGRHNMETHSIGFALLLGVLVLAWQRSRPLALACTLAAGSHVLFDWLGSDDFPPLGVMALWPFSNEFYFADAYVFATISRRYWLPGFIEHNVLAVAREIVLLAPVVAGLYLVRRKDAR